ncbi:MAG TPA: Rieske 2Fe-2S domain-containing protein, partial [Streptosporangiaceae bacterium]|nr:Rieske 2Fe-2S domain-containing protein [Streptosporangiaceae bacterium]
MVYVPHRGDLPARFGAGVPLIPDIGPAELDSRIYTDPARFEAERRKVLNRSWQIICRSSEIPGTGDHVVWEGQGETIVISRRRDGGISGFHNVCQHRGARIVPRSGQGAR